MQQPERGRRASTEDDLNTIYAKTRNTISTKIKWDGEDSTSRSNSIASNAYNTYNNSEHSSFKWNKYDDRIKAMREAGVEGISEEVAKESDDNTGSFSTNGPISKNRESRDSRILHMISQHSSESSSSSNNSRESDEYIF